MLRDNSNQLPDESNQVNENGTGSDYQLIRAALLSLCENYNKNRKGLVFKKSHYRIAIDVIQAIHQLDEREADEAQKFIVLKCFVIGLGNYLRQKQSRDFSDLLDCFNKEHTLADLEIIAEIFAHRIIFFERYLSRMQLNKRPKSMINAIIDLDSFFNADLLQSYQNKLAEVSSYGKTEMEFENLRRKVIAACTNYLASNHKKFKNLAEEVKLFLQQYGKTKSVHDATSSVDKKVVLQCLILGLIKFLRKAKSRTFIGLLQTQLLAEIIDSKDWWGASEGFTFFELIIERFVQELQRQTMLASSNMSHKGYSTVCAKLVEVMTNKDSLSCMFNTSELPECSRVHNQIDLKNYQTHLQELSLFAGHAINHQLPLEIFLHVSAFVTHDISPGLQKALLKQVGEIHYAVDEENQQVVDEENEPESDILTKHSNQRI